ncbi:uncharacterized protein LOC126899253 [Daktulosphaira vitifoliae]|uniref:uncharacterized protein LOC126899253 n=1 Tax=Daktulosphaira vitifoliae TaxID=58002 RepID=UPI0021AA2F51|nr:uncharacterized protein LOC126899253 [Daktulosphaira vitifoliae]
MTSSDSGSGHGSGGLSYHRNSQQQHKNHIGGCSVPVIVSTRCNIPKSPSRDKDLIVTGLKYASGSSLTSLARVPSPNPDMKMFTKRLSKDITDTTWFEDESDLIKCCGALQSALGLPKSFSSSDITGIEKLNIDYWTGIEDMDDGNLPRSTSELVINKSRIGSDVFMLSAVTTGGRVLDNTSRSLSTYVAVGDMIPMSQLPSPNRHSGSLQKNYPSLSTFSTTDLVMSVNKKVRQNYIQRRLVITYKALERLSHSEFNLDSLTLKIPPPDVCESQPSKYLSVPQSGGKKLNRGDILTCADSIKRYQPKPFSQFDRNMFIFNWLHDVKLEAKVED